MTRPPQEARTLQEKGGMSAIYRELYRLNAPNGDYVTVEECDGLFRFVAWSLYTDEMYDGQIMTLTQVDLISGVYNSANDAERDARANPLAAERKFKLRHHRSSNLLLLVRLVSWALPRPGRARA